MLMNSTPAIPRWSSRLAFVLASAGSAVGLGNIWKFPYIVGENGGGAFVLVYLACIALIGLPILVAEIIAGRRGGPDPVEALGTITSRAERPGPGRHLGLVMVVTAALVLSLYSVVAGWAVAYVGFGAAAKFQGGATSIPALFDSLLASPGALLLCHTLFLGATAFIVSAGVKDGLERAARWMMPALFAILIALVVHAAFSSGQFGATLDYLLRPRWETLTVNGVLEAVGHAFFSLSVGIGAMLAYGAYASPGMSVGRMALAVATIDTLTALLAAFAIFPLVFASQLEPGAGPGLLFVTLPQAFATMPAGNLLGTVFFVFIVLAALTSSISLLEPVVNAVVRRARWSRKAAVAAISAVVWLAGVACLLSTNEWSDVRILGMGIIDFVDGLTSGLMLPLCGALMALGVGWAMREDVRREELGDLSAAQYLAWRTLLRYVAPVAVFGILLWKLW